MATLPEIGSLATRVDLTSSLVGLGRLLARGGLVRSGSLVGGGGGLVSSRGLVGGSGLVGDSRGGDVGDGAGGFVIAIIVVIRIGITFVGTA